MIIFFKKTFTPAEVYNVFINFEKRIFPNYIVFKFFCELYYIGILYGILSTIFLATLAFLIDLSNRLSKSQLFINLLWIYIYNVAVCKFYMPDRQAGYFIRGFYFEY
jgi:hypothetical protein